MKKIMILLSAIAMSTLAVQAEEAKQAVEVNMASMEADVAAATDKTKQAVEDDTNDTKEEAPKAN